MIQPAYYRSRLLPEEQKAYREIVNALLRHRGYAVLQIPVSGRTAIIKIVRAVHLDHPELVYVDFWNYHTAWDPLSGNVTVYFRFLLPQEASDKVVSSLKERAALLRGRVHGLSIRQKYSEVIREVAGTTKYEDTGSAFWDHTAAGPVLLHSAVCEGIAKIFLYYCQHAGIPCAIITGSFKDMPHAWNMVELNGDRLYLDLTTMIDPSGGTLPDREGTREYFRTRKQLIDTGYVWDSGS